MFDRGYITPYMVTDTEKMEAICRRRPTSSSPIRRSPSSQDILPMLEQLVQAGKKLFIIAEDVEGEALSTLLVNRLRGTLNVRVRQGARLRRSPQGDAAGYRHPDRRSRSSASELGLDAEGRHRRHARPCPSDQGHQGEHHYRRRRRRFRRPSRTAWRRSSAQIDITTSEYDKEKLQERLAKLAGGVAVIKVGAATETEMKEKKLRIEDALNATTRRRGRGHRRRRRHRLSSTPSPLSRSCYAKVEGDEKTGVQIIAKALHGSRAARSPPTPASTAPWSWRRSAQSGKVGYGFDAYNEVYCDMIPAGIVDPTKVTRTALENAASIVRHGSDDRVPRGRQARTPARTRSPRDMPAAWAACINRHRKALKLLDFLSVQKRIYAKLTPRIQAHYRVTEIGTCLKSRCRFFLIYASAFNCRSCGTMSATEITNAIQSAMGVTHAIPETPTAWFKISMNTTSRLPL